MYKYIYNFIYDIYSYIDRVYECMYLSIQTHTDFTLLGVRAVSRIVRADTLRRRPSPVPALARVDLKRCGTCIYMCVYM
jgi:hypothetical protein